MTAFWRVAALFGALFALVLIGLSSAPKAETAAACTTPEWAATELSTLGFAPVSYTAQEQQAWLRAYNEVPPVSNVRAPRVGVWVNAEINAAVGVLCDADGVAFDYLQAGDLAQRLNRAARGAGV